MQIGSTLEGRFRYNSLADLGFCRTLQLEVLSELQS